MKNHVRHISIPLVALLVGVFTRALAQRDDDGTLFFPPKLTVHASTDDSWWYRLYSRSDDESSSTTESFDGRIVLTRDIEAKTLIPLPVVFFDQGSYVVPEKYQQFTGSAEADRYVDSGEVVSTVNWRRSDDILKYYEILNVIGYRLTQSPGTTIALEGGYSTEPGESEEIARERAQIVSEYLTTIWHIEPERIALLPPRRMCDSTATIFRQEESRRVIFHSEDPELFRTVQYHTSDVNTPAIVFSVVIDPQMAPEDVFAIDLMIASGEEILSRTSIPVSMDSTTYRLVGVWGIPRYLEDIEESLSIQAFVRTVDGRVRGSNQVSIPIVIEIEEEEDYSSQIVPEEYIGEAEEKKEEIEWVDDETEEYANGDADSTSYEEDPSIVPQPAGEPYYGSIPFFESSDTALNRLQESWIRRCVDSINLSLSSSPGNRWQIRISATGEGGEMPGVENGDLISQQATYRSVQSYYEGLARDRSFQISMYFIPSLVPRGEDFDDEAFNTSIINAWYGDRAGEIRQQGEEWSTISFYGTPSEEARERADTFLIRRAEGMAQYLRTRFDTARIDTIISESNSGYLGFAYKYSPEERFYERMVTISVEPSYYYDNGWDEYDEEYEEGEYEEGKHEEGEYNEHGEEEYVKEYNPDEEEDEESP